MIYRSYFLGILRLTCILVILCSFLMKLSKSNPVDLLTETKENHGFYKNENDIIFGEINPKSSENKNEDVKRKRKVVPISITKKCSKRHEICRNFGPLPISCCAGLSCKVVYGDYHCLQKWETTE